MCLLYNHSLTLRGFSKATIKASLDQSKIDRRQFIKSELNENPEFFKAYPHMQTIFAVNEDATNVDERHQYEHDAHTGFKDI